MIDGKYVKLGYYDTQNDNLTWHNIERWIGGKVPQDRTIIKKFLRTVSLPLFICMCTISSVGIAIATLLIIFNIWNRHRRLNIYALIKYRVNLISLSLKTWIRKHDTTLFKKQKIEMYYAIPIVFYSTNSLPKHNFLSISYVSKQLYLCDQFVEQKSLWTGF